MNRLRDSASLYLRQHADNPVDWWPWGPEALAAARETGKPILLSVGYSACHWCHVMAHECFEDEKIAAEMNRLFINIKVDREERPDIDRIYQTAHQLMVQRAGGWPLTMFLTPEDQLPFFGGTYFPPLARHGLPAFSEVLEKVAEFHAASPEEAARQGAAVQAVFDKLEPEVTAGEATIDEGPATVLRGSLESRFDATYGGFGHAPKFPQSPALERMLNTWRATASDASPDLKALLMASLSMTRMIQGGLFDQVGGGFYRYCVDVAWQIPHFEKMLYDNGLLLSLCADLHQATGDALYRDAGERTVEWLLREMRDEDGAFFATLDADAEGEEGATYTVTPDEVREVLEPAHFDAFAARFGLDAEPNFEGRWHLTVHDPDAVLDAEALASARHALLAARSHRPQPGRDEKIVTAWNALAITGLARCAWAYDSTAARDAAMRATEALHGRVWDGQQLYSVAHGERPAQTAFLDDYVLLANALADALQLEWRSEWCAWATTLLDTVLARFEDRERGGFFFTADNAELLMYRSKPVGDDATPAGNAIAVRVLTRLGHLLGRSDWLEAAERTLRWARPAIAEYPEAHISIVDATALHLAPPQSIVLRGHAPRLAQWQRDVKSVFAPFRDTYAIPADADDLPPALAAHAAPDDGVTAYVCSGTHCDAPISDWPSLAAAIRER